MALLHGEGFCAGAGAVGNFPVEKLWTTYAEVVRVTIESLTGLSAGEQGAVLHDTATRVYRLAV